ncbi:hypothetical protein, partial [Ferrimicrobium acidiphilum]|uniref:hypothetical protein n=1 Tax=Ferrimicrobium acidiphilum TaxID=121039 RepID=UPI0034DDA671
MGIFLYHWKLGFRQSSFRHITRAPRPLAPYAWAREPVQWHAIVPFVFRVQVSHWTQGYHLHSLPTVWGICPSASWRSYVEQVTVLVKEYVVSSLDGDVLANYDNPVVM